MSAVKMRNAAVIAAFGALTVSAVLYPSVTLIVTLTLGVVTLSTMILLGAVRCE